MKDRIRENMVLEDLNRAEAFPSRKVLVVGSGPVSAATVSELSDMGYEVLWTSREQEVEGLGKGATFCFDLPCAAGPDAPTEAGA